MNTTIKNNLQHKIQDFSLPSYHEIPELGLYLEQTAQYINSYLQVLPGMEITASMIGNYVKKGMIDRPTKKLYSRDQIAYLFFITIGKSALSLEHMNTLFQMQRAVFDEETAYNYFRMEFQNVLEFAFGLKSDMETIGQIPYDYSDEKDMLRYTIFTIISKLYLEMVFEEIEQFKK